MILFVDKDTTLFRSSSIRYRGWLYLKATNVTRNVAGSIGAQAGRNLKHTP